MLYVIFKFRIKLTGDVAEEEECGGSGVVSVLVQWLECLELTVTSACSFVANSESGSGLPAPRPESVGGCLQYR